MKIIKIIYIFLIIAMSSCFKDKIDIDLNKNNKKVVVEAWITNLDEPQFVKLSYTSNYFDDKTDAPIRKANVDIQNGVSNYTLKEKNDGVYYLPDDWNGEINKDYVLTIHIEGEEYVAKSRMRACPEIEDLYVAKDQNDDGEEEISVNFSFNELVGEGDGYFGRDYKSGSVRKDSLSNGSIIFDDFIDGIRLDSISFTEESFEIGDTAIVELYSIGKEAANFLQDIENEKYREGLFDPPPVNIRTNISNGAVGYFIIGGASRKQIIIK